MSFINTYGRTINDIYNDNDNKKKYYNEEYYSCNTKNKSILCMDQLSLERIKQKAEMTDDENKSLDKQLNMMEHSKMMDHLNMIEYFKPKIVPQKHDKKLINNIDVKYYKLVQKVFYNDNIRETRNGKTKSLFGKQLTFDISKDLMILKSKHTSLYQIQNECNMFLNGLTDTNLLEAKNINIWKMNTNKEWQSSHNLDYPEGDMGPMYGFQWRHYNGNYVNCFKDYTSSNEKGVDQLMRCINLIINNPMDRNIIMTSINPEQLSQMCLPPCHSNIIQFYVTFAEFDEIELSDGTSISINIKHALSDTNLNFNKYLSDIKFLVDDELFYKDIVPNLKKIKKISMSTYNRSQDLFLGVPYNITMANLIVLKVCDWLNKLDPTIKHIPDQLIINMGDCHLYDIHMDAVQQYLNDNCILDMSNEELKDYSQHNPNKNSDLSMYKPHKFISIPTDLTSTDKLKSINYNDYKLIDYIGLYKYSTKMC